jgi:hypothetical protein
MAPKHSLPELHGYRHQAPLDQTHHVVIVEELSFDGINYVEVANFQAASAESSVPMTGQGRVVTRDPDVVIIVDGKNYQRVTILNAGQFLLHKLTFTSSTVLHEKGPVVLGLQFIKRGTQAIPVTIQATGTAGRYRIGHSGAALSPEELGEVNGDNLPDLLFAISIQMERKHPVFTCGDDGAEFQGQVNTNLRTGDDAADFQRGCIVIQAALKAEIAKHGVPSRDIDLIWLQRGPMPPVPDVAMFAVTANGRHATLEVTKEKVIRSYERVGSPALLRVIRALAERLGK